MAVPRRLAERGAKPQENQKKTGGVTEEGGADDGWLLGGDCDPKAERLALVKQALTEHPHIEGLFWE